MSNFTSSNDKIVMSIMNRKLMVDDMYFKMLNSEILNMSGADFNQRVILLEIIQRREKALNALIDLQSKEIAAANGMFPEDDEDEKY